MTVASIGTVSVFAPLTGILAPIETVPDPVFAKKTVGEGFSIDPISNVLVAPVAGEVVESSRRTSARRSQRRCGW